MNLSNRMLSDEVKELSLKLKSGEYSGVDIMQAWILLADLEKALDLSEERLINAFNLVKNGKQITHLKFEGFQSALNNTVDYRGEFV